MSVKRKKLIPKAKVQNSFVTLDKDYGRTKFAGPGYGEFNAEAYQNLEKAIKGK